MLGSLPSSGNDVPILECSRLSRIFRVRRGLLGPTGFIRAVDDVTFSVPRGEVLAIVGESGCGKTTLARMLLGLLPPSHGEIRVARKQNWRRSYYGEAHTAGFPRSLLLPQSSEDS